MEMIQRPLKMTISENRAALAEAEQLFQSEGHEDGNRHERRLAARRDRQERKRQLAAAR